MNADGELFRQRTVTEHFDEIVPTLGQTTFHQLCGADRGSIVKTRLKVGNIDDRYFVGESLIVESSLGNPSSQRHLPTLKRESPRRPSPTAVTIVASTGCLTVTGTGAAPDPFALFILGYAAMDVIDNH